MTGTSPAWNAKPRPTREEIEAATKPDSTYNTLGAHFGLSRTLMRAIMREYDLPPFPPGDPSKRGDPLKEPKTRARVPLDDVCDRAAAEWRHHSEWRTRRVLRLVEQGPGPTINAGEAWRDHALCVGLDPTIFLPEKRTTKSTALAKSICAVCPVRHVCPESETTRHLRKRRRTAAA